MARENRKTVTFEHDVFEGIQQFRAQVLKNATKNEDELTFTHAVNMLCKAGLEWKQKVDEKFG